MWTDQAGGLINWDGDLKEPVDLKKLKDDLQRERNRERARLLREREIRFDEFDGKGLWPPKYPGEVIPWPEPKKKLHKKTKKAPF